MAQGHDEPNRSERRRARRERHGRDEASLAPLPAYGTLPPAAPWRHEAPAERVEDEKRDRGGSSNGGGGESNGGTGGPQHRRPSRSTSARPLGATELPDLVTSGFLRPLPARTAPPIGDVLAFTAPPSLDPLPRLAGPAHVGAGDLIDPYVDTRRRAATAVAGMVAGAVTLPPALGLSPVTAAIDPIENPAPPVTLPAAIEPYAPFLGQTSCDPHAKPGVQSFVNLVLTHWGQGRSSGIVRECSRGAASEHKEGRAWDWSLDPNDYADQVAGQRVVDWLLADKGLNARRLGVMYIIWNSRIWAAYQRDDYWRPYNGPSDHRDHIHFSFSWAGAMQRTSWWTGQVAPIEFGPCRVFIGDAVPVYGETINLNPCPAPKRKPEPKDDDKGKSENDSKRDKQEDDKPDKKKANKDKKEKKAKKQNKERPVEPQSVTVTVRRGDTLGTIARRHDTTARAIAELNDLRNPNRIFVGQQLQVRTDGAATAGSGGADSPRKAPKFRVVTVRPGDTLFGLARRHDSTVAEITKANKLANPNRLSVGQELKIPA